MNEIKIDYLKVGMTVIKSDKPWLKLPFFGGPIGDKKAIQILKNYGIKTVYVKDTDLNPSDFEMENKFTNQILDEAKSIDISEYQVTLEDIEQLKKIHIKAKKITKEMFLSTKMGNTIDTAQAQDIVKTFVDSCFKKPGIVTSLSRLKSYDDYTFTHSINVCVLSIALGKKLGFDGISLQELGIGGLLHDIGKMHIPDKILNKPGQFTEEEYAIMKNHPQLGYDYLVKQKNIPREALMCVLQHHERSDGGGYPNGLKEWEITKFGKITSIVDTYDAITSDRIYSKGSIPTKALKMIFGWSGTKFNEILVKFFLDILGIYPVGTLVLLDTEELAVVFEVNRKNPTSPKVLIISNYEKRIVDPVLFSLEKYNLITKRPYKTIVSPLDPKRFKFNTNYIIDKFIKENKTGENI